MNNIAVTGICDLPGAICLIETDEYVPLRFRSYAQPIGANFVRLGDNKNSLLEIAVDPQSLAARGVTLTMFQALSAWPEVGLAEPTAGLPVLADLWSGSRYVHLRRDFRTSIRATELLVSWGDLSAVTSSSVFGPAQFLVCGEELRGIHFSGISMSANSALLSHRRC